MAEKNFQKQKLNKMDHQKTDDAAKRIRSGIKAAGAVMAVGWFFVKFLPKLFGGNDEV